MKLLYLVLLYVGRKKYESQIKFDLDFYGNTCFGFSETRTSILTFLTVCLVDILKRSDEVEKMEF